jgi:Domain of unknown function (DUF3291)
MSLLHYHLAQINIARMIAQLDSPVMAGFVAQLEPVNTLADRSPGFIWRLPTESGDATSVQAYPDPRVIVNMSVWESAEALRDFVYKSGISALYTIV